MQARMLKEQQVDADRVLEALVAALAQNGTKLLTATELSTLQDAMAALANTAKGDDTQAIKDAIEVVDKASQDFASRRMDESIQQALAGQSVDDI